MNELTKCRTKYPQDIRLLISPETLTIYFAHLFSAAAGGIGIRDPAIVNTDANTCGYILHIPFVY